MVTAAPREDVAPDTKERILDVGERLFAEHGFESVSIRSLTAEAEVNLAAVNYHFGSKEALIEAVVARRVGPINLRRMELLAEVETGSGAAGEQIVAAFIDPVIEVAQQQGEDNRFCKLMSRCIAARDEKISELVVKQFPEVLARFVATTCQCFPGLSQETATMRLLFMAGAMAHSLFHHDKIGMVSEGRCEVPSLETLRDEMVAFLAPGLGVGERGGAR